VDQVHSLSIEADVMVHLELHDDTDGSSSGALPE
jgi:hypothetical protein